MEGSCLAFVGGICALSSALLHCDGRLILSAVSPPTVRLNFFIELHFDNKACHVVGLLIFNRHQLHADVELCVYIVNPYCDSFIRC